MGTNFYFIDTNEHIGKRSAAGYYCWDCGETLCVGGKEKVHLSFKYWPTCIYCGKEPEKEPLEESASGRELGFNENKPAKKTGVKTCSSFSWACEPIKLIPLVNKRKKTIRDEYGREFTGKEFMDVMAECPIMFYDSIGKEFS